MNTDMVAHIIQSILAPVLMINGCAILVGALFTRYGGINDRLRTMAHERLDLLRSHHEGLIRENWIPLDIIHLLKQMDVDVFERLQSFFQRGRIP